MLRTNSKKVLERIKSHVLEHYSDESHTWHGTITPAQAVLNDCEAVRAEYENTHRTSYGKYHASWYELGRHIAQGGAFLCYNGQMNDFLREVLEETPEQAEKFLNKSFDLYTHLIGRAVEEIKKDLDAHFKFLLENYSKVVICEKIK